MCTSFTMVYPTFSIQYRLSLLADLVCPLTQIRYLDAHSYRLLPHQRCCRDLFIQQIQITSSDVSYLSGCYDGLLDLLLSHCAWPQPSRVSTAIRECSKYHDMVRGRCAHQFFCCVCTFLLFYMITQHLLSSSPIHVFQQPSPNTNSSTRKNPSQLEKMKTTDTDPYSPESSSSQASSTQS